MTDQERQLLEELAGRIQKAPPAQIDREADDLIRKGIGSRSDALYILTQTVLIQEMALNQLKQQLEELKRQQPATSFLGKTPPQGGLGWGQENRAQQPAPPTGYRASSYQSGYAPPPVAQQQPQQQPQQPPPLPQYAPQSGFSSFLQSAAQTAAGVVAGEVAFSAISSLFGHHGGYYGGVGGGFLGGGQSFVSPVSETIINNNYYEGDRDERTFVSENDSGRAGHDAGLFNASDTSAGDSAVDDNTADDTGDDTSDDYTDDAVDDGSSYDDGSDSTDI
jgi:uncharacterized protein